MVEAQLDPIKMEPDRAQLLASLKEDRLALERDLLPRIFTILQALSVRTDSSTTLEMDGLTCKTAIPNHVKDGSLAYDEVVFTPDATGLTYLENRSTDAAKEALELAQNRGIVSSGHSMTPLSEEEFGKLKIISAQVPGIHHIDDQAAARNSVLPFGCQDALDIVRTSDLICCAISDGASGVKLSGYGSELLVKSATYHVVELLEELKPSSLLEPEFRGKLHARIYEDIVRYCYTLNMDPEVAFNNLFGATLDIKIVTPAEHITLSISDGMLLKEGKAQNISEITNRDTIIPPKHTMPPTPAILLVVDAGLKLPPGREGEKTVDGITDLEDALATESLAFTIIEHGETREILEGKSSGVGSDGLRFTSLRKFPDTVCTIPIKEWHDRYGENAEIAEALYLIAVNLEKDAEQILTEFPKWRRLVGEDLLYTGTDISIALCKESPEFNEAVIKGCRSAVRKLISYLKNEVNPEKAFSKLPSDPGELKKLFLENDDSICNRVAESLGIDPKTLSDAIEIAGGTVTEAGRKKALEILKRDFNFDPNGKPLIPSFDDVTYFEICKIR